MPRYSLPGLFVVCVALVMSACSAEPDPKNRDWPQWRGPNRDGVSAEKGFLQKWDSDGPPLAFKTKGLGNGHSSVVISGGKLFTMGGRKGQTLLLCLDANSGEEQWASPVGKGSGDGPSSTPTIDGERVYALGPNGDLVCLTTADGQEVWHASYTKDFGGAVPGWRYCESPLVDGNLLIGTPGGDKATLVAFNKLDGKVVWKCLVPTISGSAEDSHGGYSSPVISRAGGIKQYVQLAGRGVVGVKADDGTLLWQYTKILNRTANIPTPIVVDDYVFCSTGYGAGTALLKLAKKGAGVTATEVWFKRGNTLQNHHGGMVRVGDYVYMGHGHNDGVPVCVKWKTGDVVWKREDKPGSGSAAIVLADGQIYFRWQNGTLGLIAASPKGYQLNGSFDVPGAHEPCWSHPVVHNGKLYLRDQDNLVVYNVDAP